MRRKARWAALSCLVVSACHVGGFGGDGPPGPLGTRVDLELRSTDLGRSGGSAEGELLMVRDDGVVVLLDGRALLARWEEIAELSFPDVPVERLRFGTVPPPALREPMRRVSRYPYPLTEEQLARVLAWFGQTELDRVP